MKKKNKLKEKNIKKVNLKRENFKAISGITLIALVVTIIVLLILAGLAINLTVGNNGLFKRAQNATNTWKKAELNEQEEMRNLENLYDETLNNIGLENGEEVNKKPIGEIIGNETTKTDTTDKVGNRIVVPVGFKVVNPESTVNEGIVIEDVREGNTNRKSICMDTM